MIASHELQNDLAGQEQLTAFCRAEYPKLVGSLGLYCGDVELAEELAQEALVRVWRRWETVRGLESPSGWVHRVAMNLATSALRSRLARWRAHQRLAGRSTSTGSADPDEIVAVRRAVRALPDRQRQALVLRYYADLPVAEVAKAMDCPAGTVKTLTSRAIVGLRVMGLEVD